MEPGAQEQQPRKQETLRTDQNFFDQQPFRTILGYVSGESHTSVNALRIALSRFVRTKPNIQYPTVLKKSSTGELTLDSIADIEEAQVNKLTIQKLVLDNKEKVGGISGSAAFSTLPALLEQLAKFSYWEEYFTIYTQNSAYDLSGDPTQRGKNIKKMSFEQPPTYSAWLKQKLLRQGRIDALEVQKIFHDGQLTIRNLNDAMRMSGKRRERRRRIGQDAAEIT